MGIQPIDLQTLYTQIDKISKAQVLQQTASQAALEAEMKRNKVEAEEKQKHVQETNAGKELANRVHEKEEASSQNQPNQDQSQKNKKLATEDVNETREIIRDPALGTKIDISG